VHIMARAYSGSRRGARSRERGRRRDTSMEATRASLSALAEADSWLGFIAEATAVGIFVCRQRFLYLNPACCEISGYSREQLLAADPLSLLAPDGQAAELAEILAGTARSPRPLLYEARFAHDGGGERWAEVTCRRFELSDGPAIIGTVVDISDRRRSTLALMNREAWFRTLAETTSTGIVVYRDRFLYSNRAFTELTGYSLDELLDMDPLEVVHPDHRALLEARGRRLRGRKGAPVRHEILLLTRAGEERWVDFTAGRIEFEGRPAALGTAFDITDRKQAELALVRSRERLHLAQRAAGVVTWDWNLLTDELVTSEQATDSLSLPRMAVPETSERFLGELVHPDDHERVFAAVGRALHHGEDYTVEHRIRLADGEELWLAERGQAIRDETGWVVRMVGVSINITERKKAEIGLRESNERLRLMMEQMPAALWTTDCELTVTSSVGSALAGLGLKANELVGTRLTDYLGTDDPEFLPMRAHLRALKGESVSYEYAWSGKSYQTHVEPLRQADGKVVGTIGVALDVTEHRRAEEALFRERERSQTTLASIGDGVIRTDALATVDYLNPMAEQLTGFTQQEARGRPLWEVYRVVDDATRKSVPTPVKRCLEEERPVMLPGERVLVARDGSEYTIRDSAAPIRGRGGETLGAVLVFKDITAVRDMEREMSYLASHDGLTGLLNRAEFERRLGRLLEHPGEETPPCALLQIDLTQLKVVNDTCGHLAGDEMLKRVARLLRSGVGSQTSLARLGADEFGLLLVDCPRETARQTAEEIRSAFEVFRFDWKDRSFEVGVAIGLVHADPGDTVSDLMIAADTACMLAKESGRNRIHEYHPEDETLAARYREMHWIHRIYKALDEGSFRLYCQPVRPLAPTGDEGLLGEVLIRMLGEDGQLILPRTFVAAAERYRLISSIDRWVVRRSFEALAAGASVGGQRLQRLAINLSGESLNDDSFLEYVVDQLTTLEVAGESILFEITETAAIANLAGAMRFIAELRERGARFVLDDFGSGLSSFAYLKNLPVDYLKISGEFVRGVRDAPIHRTLVRSINQIGHELGLKTIAEGVEDEDTLQMVTELQLDYAQGYWIAAPQPLEQG
jgi:diguanylate cyclase